MDGMRTSSTAQRKGFLPRLPSTALSVEEAWSRPRTNGPQNVGAATLSAACRVGESGRAGKVSHHPAGPNRNTPDSTRRSG